MINAAVVGLGRMGVSHFAILNMHPDVNLKAVAETSSFINSAIEKYTKVTCYNDYQKMIDKEDIDCIVITTPTRFHYEMVRYALEHDLHTFVEKPFCLTAQQGKKLVELAEEKKLVNQVGYHNRFIGTFVEAQKLIAQNAIGEVYHVLGEAYGPVVLKEKGKTWRSDVKEGGGCLYDYATHVINLIQFLVGHPESVSGCILKSIYSKGVDDAVYGTLHIEKGISGQLSVNWSDETYRKMSTQITILAKKGKIIVDAQELKVYFKEQPKLSKYEQGWNMRWITDLAPEINYYLRGEEYSAQIDHFIQSIKNKRLDNINSFRSAYMTDLVADMIREKAQNK